MRSAPCLKNGTCPRLFRALLQSQTSALDAGISQPDGLRKTSYGSLSCCPLNREQANATLKLTEVRVTCFNIQFLGFFKNRDDAALAALIEPYDLVLIQKLTSPPGPGTFTASAWRWPTLAILGCSTH